MTGASVGLALLLATALLAFGLALRLRVKPAGARR
jgi:hypothetical protein